MKNKWHCLAHHTPHHLFYAFILCTFENNQQSKQSFELKWNGVVDMNLLRKRQARYTETEIERKKEGRKSTISWIDVRSGEKKDPQQSFKCTVTLIVIMRTFCMCLYTNSDKMLFTSRCDLMLPECEEYDKVRKPKWKKRKNRTHDGWEKERKIYSDA